MFLKTMLLRLSRETTSKEETIHRILRKKQKRSANHLSKVRNRHTAHTTTWLRTDWHAKLPALIFRFLCTPSFTGRWICTICSTSLNSVSTVMHSTKFANTQK